MITVKHSCRAAIIYTLLSLWLAGEARDVLNESQSSVVNDLCEMDIDDNNSSSGYKFGHSLAFKPEDLAALIRNGRQRLSDILAGRTKADVHELKVFKNYNIHNANYFKNGLTPANFYDWISSWGDPSSTSSLTSLSIQARVETFISIIWALVDLSWERGDKFNRGAIIIEDHDKKIHDYLENLTLFCAGVEQPQDLNDGIYTIWGSNIGYSRLSKSSHFVDRQVTHYGFDARFEPKSFALRALPFGMTHGLFGRVKNHAGCEVTFIKPEEAGLADVRSLLYHTYSFFAPIPEGKLLRREKDMPAVIANQTLSLMRLLESEAENLDCLQHEEELQSIFSQIKAYPLCGSIFESTKKYDISWIVSFLNKLDHIDGLSQGVKLQVISLRQKLAELFRSKSLFLRSGSEVLFLDEELKEELGVKEGDAIEPEKILCLDRISFMLR